MLCIQCGKMGHLITKCTTPHTYAPSTSAPPSSHTTVLSTDSQKTSPSTLTLKDEWKTVVFPMRHNRSPPPKSHGQELSHGNPALRQIPQRSAAIIQPGKFSNPTPVIPQTTGFPHNSHSIFLNFLIHKTWI